MKCGGEYGVRAGRTCIESTRSRTNARERLINLLANSLTRLTGTDHGPISRVKEWTVHGKALTKRKALERLRLNNVNIVSHAKDIFPRLQEGENCGRAALPDVGDNTSE